MQLVCNITTLFCYLTITVVRLEVEFLKCDHNYFEMTVHLPPAAGVV